ncbi:hypothetical protein R0131_06940 [Clostridium sp. AL.422]|uniref:hypothetical protein n=1 Tax=Clostridium TaxID=1485 RepID=UPI00293DB57B|nr:MULTISPECIES: hypothetical protein [unclassified Clostridium]MDV4150568.1 hypothetical protein [Clostridium sp. AL.422]
MSVINNRELINGTPTMTGIFTFIAYVIVAIISVISFLIIILINSISNAILSKNVKIILSLIAVIVFIPIIFTILLFFH